MNVPKISSKTSLFLLLLVISTLTIIPYLGLTNFHTKGEPREAIVAVSMLQNDNWILPINNGGDIAYKPPFFHWCIAALSLPAGEVTEFTSRLPSALAAIIMAIACFLFFAKRSRNDIAFLASLLLLSGFEVHRAAMASRVDMVLTCFIVLAMLQLYRWWELGLKGIPIWAILFMSIATLTKGPVGIVLPCAVIGIFLLFQKVSVWKAFYKIIPYFAFTLVLCGLSTGGRGISTTRYGRKRRPLLGKNVIRFTRATHHLLRLYYLSGLVTVVAFSYHVIIYLKIQETTRHGQTILGTIQRLYHTHG